MKSGDPILSRQLPAIQKIINDEQWLESERRGFSVPKDDPVVRHKVCEVVLRVGQELRDTTRAQLDREAGESDAGLSTAA